MSYGVLIHEIPVHASDCSGRSEDVRIGLSLYANFITKSSTHEINQTALERKF